MATHPWPLRHVTKLSIGVGLLLVADSYTTNILVDAYDPEHIYAAETDTPESWRRYVEQGGNIEKAERELARLHERVTRRLAERGALRPNGLDPWLVILRKRADERIHLAVEPMTVDGGSFSTLEMNALGGADLVDLRGVLPHQDYSCASGLTKAFATAIGEGFVVFETTSAANEPHVSLAWSVRANGGFYGSGLKMFPGIELTATLRFIADGEELGSLQTSVEPGPDIEFTQFAGAGFFGPDPSAVAGGIVEAACTRLGEAWLDELTGLAPPVLAPRHTPTESCGGGDPQACILVGEDLRESDPEAALAMFQSGCRSTGIGTGASCIAAADLAMEIGGEDAWATAMIALDQGCDANDGTACLRAAAIRVSRGHEDSLSTGEVYEQRLRACDLGAAEGCMLASTQAKERGDAGKPAPVRARLLAARACAGGIAVGCTVVDELKDAVEPTIHEIETKPSDIAFDVRWGMWFQHERGEVTWFASSESISALESRFAEPIARGVVRVFAPADVPPGVRPPADAVAIFGIVSPPRNVLGQARACPTCSREAARDVFWSIGCTCLPG